MSHFLLVLTKPVLPLPGGVMACTSARSLVPTGRSPASSPAALQRAQPSAIAMAAIAAGADHDLHAAQAATELPGVGSCRVDDGLWPSPTTCLPRQALTQAIPVATTPSGSPAPRPEPMSLADVWGSGLGFCDGRAHPRQRALPPPRNVHRRPRARGDPLARCGDGCHRPAALNRTRRCSSPCLHGGPRSPYQRPRARNHANRGARRHLQPVAHAAR